MNSEINAWLQSGQDYESGLRLLSTFGQSQHLNRILQRSEPSPEHLDTIVYELTLLLDAPVEPSSKTFHRIKRETIPAERKALVVEDYHSGEADRILFEQIKEKLKYRDILHAGLEDLDEQTRKKNALLILDISDQITEDYERHDHFKKHGVLPAAKSFEVKLAGKPIDQLSEAELVRRKTNIRSKISYYKKQVNDPLLVAKQKHNAAVLKAWEKELSDTLTLLC
ncbi:MAG: hypothetical protein NT040_11135 [Bacteroidetes bacterium]|nr:hypothetical protein [Bacteroidota bacterium]